MNNYGVYTDNEIQFHYLRTEKPDVNTYKMHTHDSCEIYYFLSDHAIFHIEGNQYHLKYGDLIVIQPMEAHHIEPDSFAPYERAALHFRRSLFSSFDPEEKLTRPIYEREPGISNLFRQEDFPTSVWQYCLSMMLIPAPDRRLQILSCLIPLMNELVKASHNRPHPKYVENNTLSAQIIRYINQNLTAPLTLASLCNHFYISQSQLCRVFKRATGTSVGDYIATKRLLRAQQMLRSGVLPTKVMTECGFNDYSAFYRAYHKYFGVSPSYTLKSPDAQDNLLIEYRFKQ